MTKQIQKQDSKTNIAKLLKTNNRNGLNHCDKLSTKTNFDNYHK